jgi:hypothetical protein
VSIRQKIITLLKALAKWAAAGFKITKFAEERLNICYNCPEMRKEYICDVCGCNLKYKTRMLTEECPLKKW